MGNKRLQPHRAGENQQRQDHNHKPPRHVPLRVGKLPGGVYLRWDAVKREILGCVSKEYTPLVSLALARASSIVGAT
jgi:hypothetical protein